MSTEPESAGAHPSPVEAARRLAPAAGALSDRIERERALPTALLADLIDAGLMRMCLPRSVGGGEAEPAELLEAIGELARADAATAWCAMIASTTSLLGAYLPAEQATSIFDGGRAVSAGVFAPRGRAERRDGGYRGQRPLVVRERRPAQQLGHGGVHHLRRRGAGAAPERQPRRKADGDADPERRGTRHLVGRGAARDRQP